METIIGINEADGATIMFYVDEVLAIGLSQTYRNNLGHVAHVLASNLEDHAVREDGTVAIDSDNFNDSFYDVLDELQR